MLIGMPHSHPVVSGAAAWRPAEAQQRNRQRDGQARENNRDQRRQLYRHLYRLSLCAAVVRRHSPGGTVNVLSPQLRV